MNGVLQMNEQQANKVVAKVMRITFFIFVLVFGLNVAGIFVVDQTIMTVAFVAGSVFFMVADIVSPNREGNSRLD